MGAVRHGASHAHVRARLATLLGAERWRSLLDQPDLAGVARALQDSVYGPDLPAQPAELERSLAAALAEETHGAAAFVWGAPRALLASYGRRFELANLKTVLRGRHHGVPWQRSAALLTPLPRSRLPWRALFDAPSGEALVGLLEGTPFARPVLTVLEQQGDAAPFRFEVALDLSYLRELVRRIERLSGRDGARARTLLGNWIEVENLSWAFRYRRLAHLTPEETINYTLHRALRAGLEAVQRVVAGSSVADEAARLGYTVDPEAPEDEELASLERAAAQQRAGAARDLFDGAPFDVGAPLALLALRETEVRDLIALVEGRAAGLGRDAVMARLVGRVRGLEA